MNHIVKADVRLSAAAILSMLCLLAVPLFAGACGGAGPRESPFAADTYDEYGEPLTNAVIGTPSGTVTIGPGGSTSSAGPVAPPPLPADGGPADLDGGADAGASGGFGQWHFDDCSATSRVLADSSGGGANAQHALNGACVPGISGLGVEIRSAKDVVQIPDQPQFAVGSRVAVAAWVHPNTVSGNQPIVIKRLNNKTAFSLGVHNGNVEMSVVLTTGKTIISSAPIAAGTWSHVAGMFDGTFVFLFIDGKQFGQIFAAGTVRDVDVPIRVGATTQTQHFDGIIDEVFVSTQAVSSDTLTGLACFAHPTTLTVNPLTSGPVPVDTPFHYDIAVADNDVGFCPAAQYQVSFQGSNGGISAVVDGPAGGTFNAQPGLTQTVGADVTGSDFANPGVQQVPFIVLKFLSGNNFQILEFIPGQLSFELAQQTGCFVSTPRELMIIDTSVVDDPVRTVGGSSPAIADAGGTSPSAGVWTFGHLLREMAPTPDQAPAMTLGLFNNWLTDQTVNGFTVTARPAIQQTLLNIWPRTSDGQLDLEQAPLRLQAIVNRIDLRNLSAGSAGEGRFVFAVNLQTNVPSAITAFTVILEYNLPAQTPQDVADWSTLWHGLQAHPFPSEEYNAALETITRRFSGRGAAPGGVNGSALASLRTNENALSSVGQWELREFVLSAATGLLEETTIKETPDLSFNGTQTFADFVNQNASAISAEVPGATGVVPVQFEGSPFLAGSVFNNLAEWSAAGITNDDVRFHASLNTCNGCHGPEVNTIFLQITPRTPGNTATLSPFLTGTTVTDPAGQQRIVNDLARRKVDMTSLVCPPTDAGPPQSMDASPLPVPDAGQTPD